MFLKKFNEKSKGTIWTFCGLFIITLSIFIYSIPLQLVFLVIPILMLIIYRVPLGQGSYLKILRYLDYLFEAFKDYVIKEDLKQIMVISIIWSIFVTSLFFNLPGITLGVAMVVSSVIILLILKSLSNNHTSFLIEVVIYTLMIPIVIISNEQSVSGLLSLIITFGTINFATDRLFSLGNKALKLIREYSVNYYGEEKMEELIKCRDIMFPLAYFNLGEFTEIEIVRQLLFYFQLNDNHKFNLLFKLYKESEFSQYSFLLGEYKYYFDFNNKNFPDDINERTRYIKKLIDEVEGVHQELHNIDTDKEFAYILDQQNRKENSNLIIDLLKNAGRLDEQYKEIYDRNFSNVKITENQEQYPKIKNRNTDKQRKS